MTFCHVDESDYESSSGELTFAASFGNLSGVGDSECVDVVIVNDDIKSSMSRLCLYSALEEIILWRYVREKPISTSMTRIVSLTSCST